MCMQSDQLMNGLNSTSIPYAPDHRTSLRCFYRESARASLNSEWGKASFPTAGTMVSLAAPCTMYSLFCWRNILRKHWLTGSVASHGTLGTGGRLREQHVVGRVVKLLKKRPFAVVLKHEWENFRSNRTHHRQQRDGALALVAAVMVTGMHVGFKNKIQTNGNAKQYSFWRVVRTDAFCLKYSTLFCNANVWCKRYVHWHKKSIHKVISICNSLRKRSIQSTYTLAKSST